MNVLIEADGLKAKLNDPKTVVLDASWYMPADDRDPDAEFLQEHIRGARRFDFDGKVKDHGNELPHMLPSEEEFETAARELGISHDSHIVVYDAAGIFAAPRAWWMFKVMGHENVGVLNGGFPAWKAAGGPIESGTATPAAPGNFQARLQKNRISSADEVLASLDTQTKIVDARANGRFAGTVPEPRAGLRSGHIPGSRNLPFNVLIEDGRFRSMKEVAAQWQELGFSKNDKIIASCGTGVTASVLALSAEAAGFPPVSVYDGSWSEWGQESRSDLPIETGSA